MQEPQKDYYGLLGIEEDAREADIRKVYRRLALRYHPDKNSNDENADFNFKFVLSLLPQSPFPLLYEELKDSLFVYKLLLIR